MYLKFSTIEYWIFTTTTPFNTQWIIKVCRICWLPTKSSSQVYQCHLSLSDIWVTRQIIITNSHWSIQRLSRWPTKSSSQVYQCHLGKGRGKGILSVKRGDGARFVISREFANFFASPLMSHRLLTWEDRGREGDPKYITICHMAAFRLQTDP